MQNKQIKSEFDFKFIPAKKAKKGTILFIHGFCVDYTYFVCDNEVAENYDYYALNLPGHGSKNKVEATKQAMKSSFNFDYMSDYVIKFIEEMKLDKINLIGHSMGGAIASLVAIKIPEKINKLVLISPMNYASLYTGFTFLTKFFPKDMPAKLKLLQYLYKDTSLYMQNKE
jgi:triacylglycerol lipase